MKREERLSTESSLYASLGASSSKEGVHAALDRVEVSPYFSDLFTDFSGDPDYFSLLHSDGAGTKSLVAYLLFRETGNATHFRGLAQDSLVMNLDDVACVGAFEGLALSNVIGRNRGYIPDAVIKEIISGYKETCDKLRPLGIYITLTGGETADLGNLVKTIVVDSSLHARVKRNEVIDTRRIESGDIIVGLSNFGVSSFEVAPQSGIGSNGLTLARHALLDPSYENRFPEISDDVSKRLPTKGNFSVMDTPPELSMSIGNALLSPTRPYAPLLKKLHQVLGSEHLHALIHCTGGGQTKILRFGQKKHFVKNSLFPTPPLFNLIQRSAKVPWSEMFCVFNMGHRMEIVCPKEHFQVIHDTAQEYQIEAKIIGYVEDSTDPERRNQLTIRGDEFGELLF